MDVKYFPKVNWQLLVAIFCFLSLTIYLSYSRAIMVSTFPLDDAWIHQTYARNLYQTGTWFFTPGNLSTGSTSPLWTVLLVIGYLTGSPIIWTLLLGSICLIFLTYTGQKLFLRIEPGMTTMLPFMSIYLATEWHLVWAALSGMETILFSLVVIFFFYCLDKNRTSYCSLGLLIGIIIWIRPEGITLLGPALLMLVLQRSSWRGLWRKLFQFVIGLTIIILPYLILNYLLSGNIFPNTYYAKQAEYAELLKQPFYHRMLSLLQLPLIGSGVLLFPGFVFGIWKSFVKRQNLLISAFLWWLGFTGLYAMRLPVTYQHGRYLIPSMTIYFLIAYIGVFQVFKMISKDKFLLRVIRNVWMLSIVFVQLVFLFRGAKAYAIDVSIIESEMVTPSKWIADNTEQDSLIAAHDIGALGYYANREIIDLAGLINPEIIPIIRDEEKIKQYLDNRGVDYLMTFPKWYPLLIRDLNIAYQGMGTSSLEAGGENMVVYLWNNK